MTQKSSRHKNLVVRQTATLTGSTIEWAAIGVHGFGVDSNISHAIPNTTTIEHLGVVSDHCQCLGIEVVKPGLIR